MDEHTALNGPLSFKNASLRSAAFNSASGFSRQPTRQYSKRDPNKVATRSQAFRELENWIQCPHCQSIIQRGYSICGGCGQSLDGAEQSLFNTGQEAQFHLRVSGVISCVFLLILTVIWLQAG